MENFRFLRKIFTIGCLIFLYILVSFLVFIFSRRKTRRKNLISNCSYFCRHGLKVLGVKIRIRKIFSPEDKTYMIVCNHLSYVDVLIIASIFSASFITSVEISKDIFLGSLAKLGGSIFVERRKKTRLIKDLGSVSKVLSDGLNVVLFPEGTSTNGEAILPFKKTLFRAAIQCGVEILPVCINYISIDGVTLNKKNRDLIYWYGDMKFFPHFINLLRIKQINVQLSILPAITTTKMTSDKVSKVAYESIKKVYQASW